MAIIYSLKQIADIDHRKLGIINKFYLDVDGYTYRGLKNGTLFKYAKCSEVTYTPTTTLPVDNVCEGLTTLDKRTFGLALLHASKNYMNWLGVWIPGSYNKDDVVRDGSWTMIANKDTNDRPAPQPEGDASFLLPDSPNWNNLSFLGLVETGFRFTDLEDGFTITAFRVWIPDLSADAHYRVVTIDNNTGVVDALNIFTGEIFGNIGWHQVEIPPAFFGPGDDISLFLQSQNFSSTTTIANPFVFLGSSNQENDPLAGNCEHSNNNRIFRVSNIDRNSVDVSADNALVIGGTFILIEQDSDPLASVLYDVLVATDAGTYFIYDVALRNTGINGEPNALSDVTVTYNIPIPALTKYVVLPGHMANFPEIDGLFRFNEGPVIVNDDASGIDTFFQQYTASPDWQLVAVTASSGGGFDTQVEVFTEGITTTVVDSGQAFVINSAGTLFSNDATTVIDSTRFGVQLGHGNYDVAGSFYDISGIFAPCQVFFKVVYNPNNNGNMGIEIRAYTDKTNIPGSLVSTQTSGYKIVRQGNANEMTVAFHYDFASFPVEAIQIFGVAQNNETVTLDFFVAFINKLKQ